MWQGSTLSEHFGKEVFCADIMREECADDDADPDIFTECLLRFD